MNTTNTYQIITFFDNIEDMLNQYVDRVELTPVQLTNNIYVTGLRRSATSFTEVELHIKEIRKLKLNTKDINQPITSEGGYLMMEPDGEVWINTLVIDQNLLKTTMTKIMKIFMTLNLFHVMISTYNITDDDKFPKTEIALFESKKVACKEALKMRKKYKNVKNKFNTYNKQGELIAFSTTQINTTQQKEPTDFELITAATTT